MLYKLWEVEESPKNGIALSLKERSHTTLRHSPISYQRRKAPAERKSDAKQLGEFWALANTQWSLQRTCGHNARVFDCESRWMVLPHEDMDKPECEVSYLPTHAVYKSSSTTTKIRVIFNASAKSSSSVPLNNFLLDQRYTLLSSTSSSDFRYIEQSIAS